MASRNKKSKKHFELSEFSDSESSTSFYPRKKFKRIIVGQSSLRDYSYPSTDEVGDSDPNFINREENSVVRTAIEDKKAKFKSRNNIKPIIESKRKYNLDEDSWDPSASSDDESSNRMNKVEVVESSRKINNGTSANKYDAPNAVVTSTPLLQNKQANKKNQQDDTNIRHRIMKMVNKLKYVLSKFKLEVYNFQLEYLEDEILTEQDGENIMYNYNSIINNLKKELTVQQQNSMGPYHRCGETEAHSQSSSEIFSAKYKRPQVTKISKPDVTDNANKQSLDENCTSAVTVEKNNNTTLRSDQSSLISHLHKLKEIKIVTSPSKTSVAGLISTVHNVPDFKVLNQAYKKSIGRQSTTKEESLRNGRVKEKVQPVNYESDINSTCSTIALYSRKNGNVEINNPQGGLKHAGANKDVSSRIVSNRDVLNRDVSERPISDVSSVNGEESDEIPLTNLHSSDSEDTIYISNNKIRNFKHRSNYCILAKGKTVLTSSNSENIRPKQRSQFVVPGINNLSTNYRSHHVANSNRAYSVPERKPTEQNQYNTHVDEKLRMNCQVVIEKFRIRW